MCSRPNFLPNLAKADLAPSSRASARACPRSRSSTKRVCHRSNVTVVISAKASGSPYPPGQEDRFEYLGRRSILHEILCPLGVRMHREEYTGDARRGNDPQGAGRRSKRCASVTQKAKINKREHVLSKADLPRQCYAYARQRKHERLQM